MTPEWYGWDHHFPNDVAGPRRVMQLQAYAALCTAYSAGYSSSIDQRVVAELHELESLLWPIKGAK